MKKIFFFIFIISAFSANAQQLKKGINVDSLFEASIKDLPQNMRDTLKKEFASSSQQNRDFLLFMVTMPRTSKKLMIKNIDSNYNNIARLKQEYSKLVPRNYQVRIEFEPANPNFSIDESIDLTITKNFNGETSVVQDWQLKPGSEKLNEMLKSIHWNDSTLKEIKKLLHGANCISIENGKIPEIGFGRSGLGEYSYLIFDHELSAVEAKRYTDGCNHIFYKRNIVLKYDGGAAGPQCFPDR